MSNAASANRLLAGERRVFQALRAQSLGLSFRIMDDNDLPFLATLYASTRVEEIALVDWDEARTREFLQQQFEAQHSHYMQHYPDADWLILEKDGEPVGRLYIERWEREHRLIDIALMPVMRGKGLGEALMRDLMDEAVEAGKALTIHVEHFNPAMRLYRRLGFEMVEDKEVYHLMQWTPDGQVKTAS